MTILSFLFASQLTFAAMPAAEPTLFIPRPRNLNAFVADDVRRDNSGVAPYRFAIGNKVDVTTANQGRWEIVGNTAVWKLKVVADGSMSLNFGFLDYSMPRTGQLLIYSTNGRQHLRPFTMADNEVHRQLWTPPLDGHEFMLEVRVAAAERGLVRLRLGEVNYGYRDYARRDAIAFRSSDACNIDVACNNDAKWNDAIRSVAAITVHGTDTCSGSLINNTAMDRKMYFLTAAHCGISSYNAASVVTIWNYQNSSCRPPNSSASGGTGNGKRDQFHSGAVYRAGSAASDFTLIEMDDPANPEFNHFWAGWDRSGQESTMAVGIHHPAVADKRIAFSIMPTTTTDYLGTSSPGNGTHVRVSRWTSGTTEPGSSGSPLFDDHQRVIGQLHGGYASCSRQQDSDWYGRLSKSWEGGGTPANGLKTWLDPRGTNVEFIDGVNISGAPRVFPR